MKRYLLIAALLAGCEIVRKPPEKPPTPPEPAPVPVRIVDPEAEADAATALEEFATNPFSWAGAAAVAFAVGRVVLKNRKKASR